MANKKTTLLGSCAILLILVVSAWASLFFTGLAQEEIPSTNSEGDPALTPPPDEMIATFEAEAATWEAKRASLTIFDFRVAYLVSEDAMLTETIVSPQNIANLMGAEIFNAWDAFDSSNQTEPFGIVLLHGSMYEHVNKREISIMYRNSVFIVGIDMPFRQLADLTDDQCVENPNPGLLNRFDHAFLYFIYDVVAVNEANFGLVKPEDSESCNSWDKAEYAWINHGTVNIPLLPETLHELPQNLIADAVTYDIPQRTEQQSDIIPVPQLPNDTDSMRSN